MHENIWKHYIYVKRDTPTQNFGVIVLTCNRDISTSADLHGQGLRRESIICNTSCSQPLCPLNSFLNQNCPGPQFCYSGYLCPLLPLVCLASFSCHYFTFCSGRLSLRTLMGTFCVLSCLPLITISLKVLLNPIHKYRYWVWRPLHKSKGLQTQ